MTMERLKLKAQGREVGRKGILTELRRGGKIPTTLYGHGTPPVNLALDRKEFVRAVKRGGLNALFELDVAGGSASPEPLLVMVRDFQTDVIDRHITHLDLIRVSLKEKVTVSIPIRLTGKAVGVEEGGLIDQPTRELEVRCLPGNIPEELVVDVHPLKIGDSIHLQNLNLPSGVEPVSEDNLTIVSVVAPKAEEEAAPAEVPAEAVEGAAAPVPEAEEKEEPAENKGTKE